MIREARVYPTTALHNGELWAETPTYSRLLVAPTAIPLGKNEAYFSDFYIFFTSVAYGVSDRFTLGLGSTLFPSSNWFENNLMYVLPKLALVVQPTFSFSIGARMARVPDSDVRSVGVLYGVATKGGRENNLTVGVGWGYAGNDLARQPVLTLGGQRRISRRVALISENWALPGSTVILTSGWRFLGERLSVDLAFASAVTHGSGISPPLPVIGFSKKF
jgi:hypothetical protein